MVSEAVEFFARQAAQEFVAAGRADDAAARSQHRAAALELCDALQLLRAMEL